MSKRDFGKLLLEAVDEALSTLGESPKQAIYFHLDKSFSIKKQEIPIRIRAFEGAMEKTFGPGAPFLEILIMRQLSGKVGATLKHGESRDINFAQYVAAVRRSCEEQEKARKTEEVVE